MDINYKKFPCSEADAVIIPLFEGKVEVPNEETNRFLDLIKAKGQFKGAKGEVISFIRDLGGNLQDAIITGLGKEEELSSEAIRVALSKAVRKAKELKDKRIFIKIPENSKLNYYETAKAVAEGLGLGSYSFEKYKSNNETLDLSFSLGGRDISDEETNNINEAIEEGIVLVEAVEIARDLVNEPANALYPRTLAEKVKDLGNTYGFKVEVKENEEIKALGMEAFLTVARGAKNSPKLIVMRYYGDDSNKDKVLGLVGKGLTYDSGGYSLKPSSGMETMKSDMGGAAAVIGTMVSIARRKLKTNVIAVVAACENMISGDAYKPGDIIGSMAGKKIEVINTDAEGRLTLADAVTYIIRKEGVDEVIDVATLTGAALVALGTTTTAVITNNNEFYGELSAASEYSGERIWQLPSFPEYKKLIKSDIADLKNTGGRYAGTITAGLFIGEFVEDKPWMHLDIAGTAWNDSVRDYSPKGGTGEPLRTLYELLKRRAK
ncbi:leucyl aminopeptidase [Clostridium paridis]|uniref:Probable cytosol aminopeptidase n=1 Tax=Clostridium paridis TaxID=2803863 RepID=A0A937K3D9_9CLOT|nr:leucyl aminopeptidase [Clostridium paridis]MBL4930659.1 leucyl aminopeptidase [Clostridium paridis]